MARSGRSAVSLGSSSRSEPAAALRGLAKGSSPLVARSALICAKSSRWITISPRKVNVPGARIDKRHVADCAHVRRDVFAGLAVAPGRGLEEPAVCIDDLDARTIQLRLADILHLGLVQALSHAPVELGRARPSP